jgi:hypothetical protein
VTGEPVTRDQKRKNLEYKTLGKIDPYYQGALHLNRILRACPAPTTVITLSGEGIIESGKAFLKPFSRAHCFPVDHNVLFLPELCPVAGEILSSSRNLGFTDTERKPSL